MKTILLSPHEDALFQIEVPQGAVCEWSFDDALKPLMSLEDGRNTLVLAKNDGSAVSPGFYVITAVCRDIDSNVILTSEKFLVRVTSTSENANQGSSKERNQETASSSGKTTAVKRQSEKAPISNAEPESALPCPEQEQKSPVLTGEYSIVVMRSGVELPDVSRQLPRRQSLRIGRSPVCEISLHNQFYDENSAKLCSKEQAEVFWVANRVIIRTLGKNSLLYAGADGAQIPVPRDYHYWQPEEILLVPGGLEVCLRRTTS